MKEEKRFHCYWGRYEFNRKGKVVRWTNNCDHAIMTEKDLAMIVENREKPDYCEPVGEDYVPYFCNRKRAKIDAKWGKGAYTTIWHEYRVKLMEENKQLFNGRSELYTPKYTGG